MPPRLHPLGRVVDDGAGGLFYESAIGMEVESWSRWQGQNEYAAALWEGLDGALSRAGSFMIPLYCIEDEHF